SVGDSAKTPATVLQGEGAAARAIPVAWPLSADWSGSRGLCVKGSGKKGRCVASYSPATGVLTALRPGTVTLAVTVNGERAERRVVVAR
ncbi:hypothetical protein, partial [Streptomyces beijiangensis]